MHKNRNMRLLAILMAVVMLMALSTPAFAVKKIGISPQEVLDRFQDKFEVLSDNLMEHITNIYGIDMLSFEDGDEDYSEDGDSDAGEDGNEDYSEDADSDDSEDGDADYDGDYDYEAYESLMSWLSVLVLCAEETTDDLSAFIEVEDVRNTSDTDAESGDVYYTKANLESFIFGAEMKDDGATATQKGVYNRSDGRFTVDTNSDLYFEDKSKHLIDVFDFVEGTTHYFIQFAYYDDYNEDLEEHVYDVLRLMMNDGSVRMCIGSLTESELTGSRIKSAYDSWESFSLKGSDVDTFVFSGKELRIVEGGEEVPIGKID